MWWKHVRQKYLLSQLTVDPFGIDWRDLEKARIPPDSVPALGSTWLGSSWPWLEPEMLAIPFFRGHLPHSSLLHKKFFSYLFCPGLQYNFMLQSQIFFSSKWYYNPGNLLNIIIWYTEYKLKLRTTKFGQYHVNNNVAPLSALIIKSLT